MKPPCFAYFILNADGPCPVCQVIMQQRQKEEATRREWYQAEEEFAALVKQHLPDAAPSTLPSTHAVTDRFSTLPSPSFGKRLAPDSKAG